MRSAGAGFGRFVIESSCVFAARTHAAPMLNEPSSTARRAYIGRAARTSSDENRCLTALTKHASSPPAAAQPSSAARSSQRRRIARRRRFFAAAARARAASLRRRGRQASARPGGATRARGGAHRAGATATVRLLWSSRPAGGAELRAETSTLSVEIEARVPRASDSPRGKRRSHQIGHLAARLPAADAGRAAGRLIVAIEGAHRRLRRRRRAPAPLHLPAGLAITVRDGHPLLDRATSAATGRRDRPRLERVAYERVGTVAPRHGEQRFGALRVAARVAEAVAWAERR